MSPPRPLSLLLRLGVLALGLLPVALPAQTQAIWAESSVRTLQQRIAAANAEYERVYPQAQGGGVRIGSKQAPDTPAQQAAERRLRELHAELAALRSELASAERNLDRAREADRKAAEARATSEQALAHLQGQLASPPRPAGSSRPRESNAATRNPSSDNSESVTGMHSGLNSRRYSSGTEGAPENFSQLKPEQTELGGLPPPGSPSTFPPTRAGSSSGSNAASTRTEVEWTFPGNGLAYTQRRDALVDERDVQRMLAALGGVEPSRLEGSDRFFVVGPEGTPIPINPAPGWPYEFARPTGYPADAPPPLAVDNRRYWQNEEWRYTQKAEAEWRRFYEAGLVGWEDKPTRVSALSGKKPVDAWIEVSKRLDETTVRSLQRHSLDGKPLPPRAPANVNFNTEEFINFRLNKTAALRAERDETSIFTESNDPEFKAYAEELRLTTNALRRQHGTSPSSDLDAIVDHVTLREKAEWHERHDFREGGTPEHAKALIEKFNIKPAPNTLPSSPPK